MYIHVMVSLYRQGFYESHRTRFFYKFKNRRCCVPVVSFHGRVISGRFFIASYAPGDPLQAYYGEAFDRLSPAEMEAARHRLGLDGPVYEQYMTWLYGAIHGDFGFSLKYRQPVSAIIAAYGANTLLLGIVSYAVLLPLLWY